MDRNDAIDCFLLEFNTKKKGIEELISQLTDDTNSDNKQEVLNSVNEGLSVLRKEVSRSQHFLPSYTSKTIQSSLTSLSSEVAQVKELINPKKKFAFGKRDLKKKVKDEEIKRKESLPQRLETTSQENFVGLKELKDQKITVSREEFFDKDYQLLNLTNSDISIPSTLSTIYLNNLDNCVVRVGPVKTSVFVSDCKDSRFSLCCQQLRIHSSKGCEFFVRTTTSPIIEDSNELRFGRYDYVYEGVENDLSSSGFDRQEDFPLSVVDFNWLSEEASPNFSIIQ
jgi:hypothetical protein